MANRELKKVVITGGDGGLARAAGLMLAARLRWAEIQYKRGDETAELVRQRARASR